MGRLQHDVFEYSCGEDMRTFAVARCESSDRDVQCSRMNRWVDQIVSRRF